MELWITLNIMIAILAVALSLAGRRYIVVNRNSASEAIRVIECRLQELENENARLRAQLDELKVQIGLLEEREKSLLLTISALKAQVVALGGYPADMVNVKKRKKGEFENE